MMTLSEFHRKVALHTLGTDPSDLDALLFMVVLHRFWIMLRPGIRFQDVREPQAGEGIVHCIDSVSDEEFYGWLEGPEASNPRPSPEYLALSCLALAIDSARVRFKNCRSIEKR